MFRFTEGFVKTWTPKKGGSAPKRRDIYKPRLHIYVSDKGRCTVSMAVKRRGESWRKTIGKFPDNKLDKSQREQLDERYRKWFLLLEDESILPHDLDRREERAHEVASDAAMDEATATGHMTDLINDYLKRHASTLKTFDQIQRMFRPGEFDWGRFPITEVANKDFDKLKPPSASNRPTKTVAESRAVTDKDYPGRGRLGGLHDRFISQLDRQFLVDILRQIEAPVMANRARAQVMKLCSFGVEHGWLQTNPANNLPKNKETKRQIILTEPQMKDIWPLLTGPLKFLLATGQRRSEVARMKWTDLQGNTWTQLDTKSSQPHSLVLPIWTMSLLPEQKGIYIWRSDRADRINESTLSHQWLDASRKIGADTMLHDARRTCGTHIAKLTESTEAADRVLNHALPGITSRYVLHDFGNMKAKALQLWADKLEVLVS